MRILKSADARLLIAGVSLLAACSSLTDVSAPGIVVPEAEENATGAVARYVGAVRLATIAIHNAQLRGGMFADEFWLTGFAGEIFTTRLDARRPHTPIYETGGDFSTLMSARINIGRAEEALRQFAPTPGGRLGQLYAYNGYGEVYLAEMFCNGIPFSTIDDKGNATFGGPTGTTAIYNMAIAHFDSAMAVSADSQRVMNLARVGKGRALLQLGRYADAAAAVATVPTTFVFNSETNSNISVGQTNPLYASLVSVRSDYAVPGRSDGGNGIDWLAANDPRVPLVRQGVGADGVTVQYVPTWITSYSTPQVIASGKEARLIQAEAALQANRDDASTTGSGWLGILNDLRATAISPPMPPLADPGNFNARVDLLFRERAFWTFFTGLRMGDLRRLVRQYGRAQDAVFPVGTFKDGVPYGAELTLEPPFTESPNPNWTACTDRNA